MNKENQVKVFAFEENYSKWGVKFFIINDNNQRYSLSRYIGKYEKTTKKVLDTDNSRVINDYLNQLKLCNVSYRWTYIKLNNGVAVKKEGNYTPKGE
jgi:hypothetical protein